jgi:hypothetical protein
MNKCKKIYFWMIACTVTDLFFFACIFISILFLSIVCVELRDRISSLEDRNLYLEKQIECIVNHENDCNIGVR